MVAAPVSGTSKVLLGYSQGAEVSMDVIAGNSETGGTVTPVSTAISSHVAAITNFGDPGHVAPAPLLYVTSPGAPSLQPHE